MAQDGNEVPETAGAGLPDGLTNDIRALIDMMARGGIAELSLRTEAVKLRLRTREGITGSGNQSMPASAAQVATSAPNETIMPSEEPEGVVIPAPMIGTFYRSPGPGEPPFVEADDEVSTGQTIGIIEAMKIMNEIASEFSGKVAEFLVENGQPVEYGQPLLRLIPAVE